MSGRRGSQHDMLDAAGASGMREGLRMEITIDPELEKFVHRQIELGLYRSPSEIVSEALSLLYERDSQPRTFTQEHEIHIRQCLTEARNDIEHGRVLEVDDAGLVALGERIKQEGRERRANAGQTGI